MIKLVVYKYLNPTQMAKINQQMAKMIDPRVLHQMGQHNWIVIHIYAVSCIDIYSMPNMCILS